MNPMIDFEQAIKIAQDNAEKLVKGAKDFVLEEALISSNNKLYEIAISYELGPIGGLELPKKPRATTTNLATLASLLGKRREYKVFLVDSENGRFRGFKKYKEV